MLGKLIEELVIVAEASDVCRAQDVLPHSHCVAFVLTQLGNGSLILMLHLHGHGPGVVDGQCRERQTKCYDYGAAACREKGYVYVGQFHRLRSALLVSVEVLFAEDALILLAVEQEFHGLVYDGVVERGVLHDALTIGVAEYNIRGYSLHNLLAVGLHV